VAYVCFIVDVYSRMIVGWRVASHMRTTMVLDAIEIARWSRGNILGGLRCHSDAGSQVTSIRYGERLVEIGAVPSIGTVGDSYDNALAETVNGYYKSELIYGPAPPGAVEERRGCRAGHPRVGALAQHQPPPRLPRRCPARRVRSHLLRYETDRPTPGRNPIARVSIRAKRFSAVKSRNRAVSLRSVRFGCMQFSAGIPPSMRSVTPAVVGQNTFHAHAASPNQLTARHSTSTAVSGLVDLGVSHPRMIVYHGVHECVAQVGMVGATSRCISAPG
jgi:hypothetical protein